MHLQQAVHCVFAFGAHLSVCDGAIHVIQIVLKVLEQNRNTSTISHVVFFKDFFRLALNTSLFHNSCQENNEILKYINVQTKPQSSITAQLTSRLQKPSLTPVLIESPSLSALVSEISHCSER